MPNQMSRQRLQVFRNFVFVAASLFSLGGVANAMPVSSDLEEIKGKWETPMMDAVIEIAPCGEKLCAALVQHDYTEVTDIDIKNPDPQERGRPLIGVKILDGLSHIKDDKWANGELYDPRTGKTYGSKVKLIDENRVKISGCIGPGLCKGYIWTRVHDLEVNTAAHEAAAPASSFSTTAGAGFPDSLAQN